MKKFVSCVAVVLAGCGSEATTSDIRANGVGAEQLTDQSYAANAEATALLFKGLEFIQPPYSRFRLGKAAASINTAGLTIDDATTDFASHASMEFGSLVLAGNALPQPQADTLQSATLVQDNAEPSVSSNLIIDDSSQLGGLSGYLSVADGVAHARSSDHWCSVVDDNGERVLSRGQGRLVAGALNDANSAGTVVSLGDASNSGGISVGTRTSLISQTAGGSALRSVAQSQLGDIVLGGVVGLRFLVSPQLSVTAGGLPDTATFEYRMPVVQIYDPASQDILGELDLQQQELTFELPPRSLPQGALLQNQAVVRLGSPHATLLDEHGRHAQAEVVAVQVRFTDFARQFEFLNVEIGTLRAAATAPAGGFDACGDERVALASSPPHAIVYNRTDSFVHNSTPFLDQMLAELSTETAAYSYEITSNAAFFDSNTLSQADLVIFNNNTGVAPWSESEKATFEKWLSCGGGVVGIHGATDANYEWGVWKELFGVYQFAHPHMGYWPVVGDVSIIVEDQTHPSTKPWHGQDSFSVADEIYKFDSDPRDVEGLNPLLTLDETTVYPGIQTEFSGYIEFVGGSYIERQALAWTKSFRNQNRVFYTSLGHNAFLTDRDDYRQHVAAGIQWVLEKRLDQSCFQP